MKIDRLIGILSVLLQKEKVTAPYLAEKYEVSRRTINRDIEDLCKAGIPIVTTQGSNGGISIMEGYSMDKTLLTSSEMQAILAGLQSLDSVTGGSRYRQLMDKLSLGSSDILTSNNHILINLTSWYKGSLAPKIELIQTAIEGKHLIHFDYYSLEGESSRMIEPYLLLFQWSSWYVWGYCLTRKDFRMFKLNRLTGLTDTGKVYAERENPREKIAEKIDCPGEEPYWKGIEITAAFWPEMKWRLIEEFGVDCYREEADGRLYMTFHWTEPKSLYSFMLSFGEKAEIISPTDMREELKQLISRIGNIYSEENEMKREEK